MIIATIADQLRLVEDKHRANLQGRDIGKSAKLQTGGNQECLKLATRGTKVALSRVITRWIKTATATLVVLWNIRRVIEQKSADAADLPMKHLPTLLLGLCLLNLFASLTHAILQGRVKAESKQREWGQSSHRNILLDSA